MKKIFKKIGSKFDEISVGDYSTCYDLAIKSYNSDKYEEAIKYCDLGIKDALSKSIKPDGIFFIKGRALYSLKRYEESITCFLKVSDNRLIDESNYYEGLSHFKLNNFSKAFLSLKRSKCSDEKSEIIRNDTIVKCLFSLGSRTQAKIVSF